MEVADHRLERVRRQRRVPLAALQDRLGEVEQEAGRALATGIGEQDAGELRLAQPVQRRDEGIHELGAADRREGAPRGLQPPAQPGEALRLRRPGIAVERGAPAVLDAARQPGELVRRLRRRRWPARSALLRHGLGLLRVDGAVGGGQGVVPRAASGFGTAL
jgi:hypothetical protein